MREAREQLRESCFKQRKRALSKGDWREDARILAEHYPEEFGEPHDLGNSSENPLLPNATNAVSAEQESVAIAPGSPQSASTTLPAPLPIPPPSTLPNAFWRALLFGSPDSLIGGADATNALRLVAERIGITIEGSETIPTLRAGQLRKLLRNKFGQLQAEQTFAVLWRSAPPTPGAPAPALDQSELPSGARVDSQFQPRWARALHDPDRAQQEWLSDRGVGSC
jgi:hypothetical protein